MLKNENCHFVNFARTPEKSKKSIDKTEKTIDIFESTIDF